MSDNMSESFDVGDQTWKTPKGSSLTDGTLKEWGSVDSCHKHLQKKIDKLTKALEFYADGSSHFNSVREWDMGCHDPEIGQGTQESGKLARQTLNEIRGKDEG